MNILAIDSGSEYLSLALQTRQGRSYILEQVGNKQSNHILAKIDELLVTNKLTVAEINLIAYNQGPGSFTGLRIGLSVAMGMAFGLNIKLVPIPAFALFAHGYQQEVLVALDARLNQVYLAGLNATTLHYFLHPQVCDPDKIPYYPQCSLVGNGFRVYRSLLNAQLKPLVATSYDYPTALSMLDIVNSARYMPIAPDQADLLYLRNKVALNLTEQQQIKSQAKLGYAN